MFARLCLAAALLASAAPALAQSSGGTEGAEFGQELLQQAQGQVQSTSHDPNGGVRGSGSLQLGGYEIDVNDLVPGANRGAVEDLTTMSAEELQSRGEQALYESARGQGAEGDATRILLNGNRMSRGELEQGGAWLRSSVEARDRARSGALSELFADCQSTTKTTPGGVIRTTQQETYTCSTGQSGASCLRTRTLKLTHGPSLESVAASAAVGAASQTVSFTAVVDASDPDRMPTFSLSAGDAVLGATMSQVPTAQNGWTGVFETGIAAERCADGSCEEASLRVDVVMSVPGPLEVEDNIKAGACEAEAQINQCRIQWSCADGNARTIDGVRVDDAFAVRHGLRALAAGLPAGEICWAAQARVQCPICLDGDKRCRYGDISRPENNSCGVYEQDPSCQVQQQTCLIYDQSGQCTSWAQTYVCEREVTTQTVPTTSTTNSCAAAVIPCMGDGCRSQEDLAGDAQPGALERAAAQMAVSSAVIHDWKVSSEPGARRTGPAPRRPGYAPDEEGQGTQWGYDPEETEERKPGEPLPINSGVLANVQIFKGKAGSCRKGWGGLVDCCGTTKSDAQTRYWRIQREAAAKLRGQQQLAGDSGQAGSWQSLSSGQATMDDLSRSLTSTRENVTGGGSAAEYEGAMQDAHGQFMAEARSEIKPSLSPSWICGNDEFDLAVQREVGMCEYAGTYCDKKVLGVCLQRKEAYCCYSSPMSKMLRASVDGGRIPTGDPKEPDCRGIPVDRLDEIDWDSIRFDEIASRMTQAGATPSEGDRNNALERYTGSGVLVGGEGRPDAVERNQERLSAVADPSIKQQLEADAQRLVPEDLPAVQSGPARISFSPSFLSVKAGKANRVMLSREGGAGAVNATVQVAEGDPQLLGFYSGTVAWSADDLAPKGIVLRVAPEAVGQAFRLVITQVSDGGEVGAAPQLKLTVRE